MYHLGMLLLIKVLRRSRKKVQFMSMFCELGVMLKCKTLINETFLHCLVNTDTYTGMDL